MTRSTSFHKQKHSRYWQTDTYIPNYGRRLPDHVGTYKYHRLTKSASPTRASRSPSPREPSLTPPQRSPSPSPGREPSKQPPTPPALTGKSGSTSLQGSPKTHRGTRSRKSLAQKREKRNRRLASTASGPSTSVPPPQANLGSSSGQPPQT